MIFIYCSQYKKTLEIVCQKRKGHSSAKARYGVLNWTVQDNTEDIVYYQSYTHEVQNTKIQKDILIFFLSYYITELTRKGQSISWTLK